MPFKIDNDKLLALVLSFVMAVGGSVFIYVTSVGVNWHTVGELQKLYETRFAGSIITSVERHKYPGKGDYTVFKVDSLPDFYPALPDYSSPYEHYEVFREGGIVSKGKFSTDLNLTYGNNTIQLKMRTPKDEDENKSDATFPLLFFGFCFFVILFIPNRFYEKIRANKQSFYR